MGHVTVVGGCRAKAPAPGVLASSLAVGSTVKLMEGGTAVEYLVVNQGIPSNSSLYDASCDGTWLLRKDCHSSRVWNSSNTNTYETSAINRWLNEDFFNGLGTAEQTVIKQIKIPYCIGNGSSTVKSGANGLSCKVFLLGVYEVGWTTSDYSTFPVDGAKLDYFGASSGGDSKRIAYLNGLAINWWLRSPDTENTSFGWLVRTSGNYGGDGDSVSISSGIRPALILPPTAKFDATTMLLKG